MVRRRFRHLLVVLLAWIVQGRMIQILLAPMLRRPRPFRVEFRTDWTAWALPSEQMAALVVGPGRDPVQPGAGGPLAPDRQVGGNRPGRPRPPVPGGRGTHRHPGGRGDRGGDPAAWVPLARPSQVFPVSYRRGRTAHLDVSGARGLAIRQALHDQLGLVVDDVQPFAHHPDQPSSCDATPMPGSLQRITSPLTVASDLQ
jgi:hypothetical protein